MNDFSKFESIFAAQYVATIRGLVELATKALRHAQSGGLTLAGLSFNADEVSFGAAWATAGASADAIADRLYGDSVPFCGNCAPIKR
jgi:hypothetical protein